MLGRYRPLWLNENGDLEVIDQRYLPHENRIRILSCGAGAAEAISDMTVRGAGVIGNVAAFGVYLIAREFNGDKKRIAKESAFIRASRPTAVNLMWAVDRMLAVIKNSDNVIEDAKAEAIIEDDFPEVARNDVGRTEAFGE